MCDDRRLVVGVGPAGTGKTTAMQLTAEALAADGRRLVAVEAGMAGTPALGRLLELSQRSGAVVRLLGDPMQLSVVEAGGALRLLAHAGQVGELDQVHRFADPDEATATLRLRQGHPSALGFYEANDRLEDGSRPAMVAEAYDAWRQDVATRRVSLMVSASAGEAAELRASPPHRARDYQQ